MVSCAICLHGSSTLLARHYFRKASKRLRSLDPGSLPAITDNPRIGPCVGAVGKLVGVGLNYSDHAAESNMPIPSEPPLFEGMQRHHRAER